jgi:hypothetical protein
MPIVTVTQPLYTDVILAENTSLGNYFSRDIVTVTTTTATGTYPLGTVLFRAKAVDDSVAWDVLDAAGEILMTNEYALLIGDVTGEKPEGVALTSAVAKSCTVIRRDARVRASGFDTQPLLAALTANNRRDLKGQLLSQNRIKVEASDALV